MAPDHDYEAGKRDGKIEAIEAMQITQNQRLDTHEVRLSKLEKVSYIILGAVLMLEMWPTIAAIFN